MSNETATSHVLNTSTSETQQPETATQVTRVLKKRGRKGDKIAQAFKDIPRSAVNFEEYAQAHNVSPNVLRQIKRHDHYTDQGKVFVRKNKETKTMMIWREEPLNTGTV